MTHRIPIRFLAMSLVLTCTAVVHAQVGRNMGVLNPNTATEAELQRALPHMNAARAATIVDRRPFRNMFEVHTLVGQALDEAAQAELYSRLFLPLKPERDNGRRYSLGARCRRTHGP